MRELVPVLQGRRGDLHARASGWATTARRPATATAAARWWPTRSCGARLVGAVSYGGRRCGVKDPTRVRERRRQPRLHLEEGRPALAPPCFCHHGVTRVRREGKKGGKPRAGRNRILPGGRRRGIRGRRPERAHRRRRRRRPGRLAVHRRGRFQEWRSVLRRLCQSLRKPSSPLPTAFWASRPRDVHVITGRPDLDEESDGEEIKVEEISVHREYPREGAPRPRGAEPQGARPERRPSCCRPWPRTSPRPSRATSFGSPGGAARRRPAGIPRTYFSMSRSSRSRMRIAAPTSASSAPPRRSARSARRSAPGHYNDSCFGDSGGPLVADAPRGALLVGIVSYGGSKCGVKKPGVYAEVADNLGFIERKAGL